jgi:hypothetical protein
MEWIITIYATILFIIFTPNFLFIFSKKRSKFTNIIIHTIIFLLVFHITIHIIKNKNKLYENLSNNTENPKTVNICNKNNIDKYNNLGQQCQLNNDNNYIWVTPCDSNNIDATSYSGNINVKCVNIYGNTYNWIPIKL